MENGGSTSTLFFFSAIPIFQRLAMSRQQPARCLIESTWRASSPSETDKGPREHCRMADIFEVPLDQRLSECTYKTRLILPVAYRPLDLDLGILAAQGR